MIVSDYIVLSGGLCGVVATMNYFIKYTLVERITMCIVALVIIVGGFLVLVNV